MRPLLSFNRAFHKVTEGKTELNFYGPAPFRSYEDAMEAMLWHEEEAGWSR